MPTDDRDAPAPLDGVQVRTLVVGGLPLLVTAVGDSDRAVALRTALADGGLRPLESFLGADLPRGAKVGFVLDRDELRLVDERDATLFRAPRSGIDQGWQQAAVRLRGTMLVQVGAVDLAAEEPARLASTVDAHIRADGGLGAIVGVVEERQTLPLLL